MQPYRLLVDVLIVKICLLRHRIRDFANKTHANFPKNMKEINKQKKNGMRARDHSFKEEFFELLLNFQVLYFLLQITLMERTLNAVL